MRRQGQSLGVRRASPNAAHRLPGPGASDIRHPTSAPCLASNAVRWGAASDAASKAATRRFPSLSYDTRIQFDAIERRHGLCQCSLDSAKVSDASGPPGSCHQIRVKPEHLAEREISHLASLRYSSSFFERTNDAARSKSSAGRSTRSATAAEASCSGEMPNDFARSRRVSSWVSVSSTGNCMDGGYRISRVHATVRPSGRQRRNGTPARAGRSRARRRAAPRARRARAARARPSRRRPPRAPARRPSLPSGAPRRPPYRR